MSGSVADLGFCKDTLPDGGGWAQKNQLAHLNSTISHLFCDWLTVSSQYFQIVRPAFSFDLSLSPNLSRCGSPFFYKRLFVS